MAEEKPDNIKDINDDDKLLDGVNSLEELGKKLKEEKKKD